MILGILKEPSPETRVSLHPEAVKVLTASGNKILIEKGAGESSFIWCIPTFICQRAHENPCGYRSLFV